MDNYIKMCYTSDIQSIRKGFSSGYIGERWLQNETVRTYSGRQYVGGLWIPTIEQLFSMIETLPWSLTNTGTGAYRFQFLTSSDYWIGFTKKVVVIKGIMQELHQKKWFRGEWLTKEEIRKKCIKNICSEAEKLNW